MKLKAIYNSLRKAGVKEETLQNIIQNDGWDLDQNWTGYMELCFRGIPEITDAIAKLIDNNVIEHHSFNDENLEGYDLINCNLANVNFFYANLTYVNFSGSNLCGADLRTDKFDDLRVIGATFNKDTKWPTGFDPIKNGAIKVPKKDKNKFGLV